MRVKIFGFVVSTFLLASTPFSQATSLSGNAIDYCLKEAGYNKKFAKIDGFIGLKEGNGQFLLIDPRELTFTVGSMRLDDIDKLNGLEWNGIVSIEFEGLYQQYEKEGREAEWSWANTDSSTGNYFTDTLIKCQLKFKKDRWTVEQIDSRLVNVGAAAFPKGWVDWGRYSRNPLAPSGAALSLIPYNIDDTPYVGLNKIQLNEAIKAGRNSPLPPDIEFIVGIAAMPTWAGQKLPAGTLFEPYLVNRGDPDSALILRDRNGRTAMLGTSLGRNKQLVLVATNKIAYFHPWGN